MKSALRQYIKLCLTLSTCLMFIVSCTEKKTGITLSRGSITESVYASGTIKAKGQYNVYPSVNGILKKIYVTSGDTVVKGQTLFLIENKTAALNTDNAKLAYEIAKENIGDNSPVLKELKLNVSLAKEKMELDSSLYVRQKKLWEQNVGTKNEMDQKELSFSSSKTSYKNAVQKLVQSTIQLNNEFNRAKNNLLISQKQTGDYTVKSELDGKVYDIKKEPGELVGAQTLLAVIGESTKFILELQVDEFDISKISLGQKAKVGMDSYKKQVFDAVITKINPIMNENSRSFKLEAEFINPPPVLYPYLTAEANIIINTKSNALIIPSEYLIEDRYVLGEGDKKLEVKTGLKDYQHVEILSGLDSVQVIYLPKP